MSKYAGFNSVELHKPQKSIFDLSHTKRTSTRMGRLTPILNVEAIPGDTFRGSSEVLCRLAPLLAPIYDEIIMYVHYFFVPNRLLWEEWEEFITGGRLGENVDPVTAPIPPRFDIGAMINLQPTILQKSTTWDYLGGPVLPIFPDDGDSWNSHYADLMPMAAVALCWMEYYRDRNFVADDELAFPLPSGTIATADAIGYLQERTRHYLKDYFTSGLPFTQRGSEVLIPIIMDGYAPIVIDPVSPPTTNALVSGTEDGTPVGWSATVDENVPASQGIWARLDDANVGQASSINDLRTAWALQSWLERNAIGGSRYTESIQAHFAVRPQDARLQRPEYIGGGRIRVNISEVVTTSYSTNEVDTVIPAANLAGHGVTYGDTNQFNYFCTEHGFIIGLLSIMNPPSYHQGLPKMFRRRSFLDYPWPAFAKLGEQPIEKLELYAIAANDTPDANGELPLFAYTARYSDWKNILNTSHGDFHDDLLFWTLTRQLTSNPVLGEAFLEFEGNSQDRLFAVNTGTDYFWLYVHNRLSVKRALPYYGTPATIGA